MTDVNGAFQTISSQIRSENIYDSALNGSPKKQNSQSPTNRVSDYGKIFGLFDNYEKNHFSWIFRHLFSKMSEKYYFSIYFDLEKNTKIAIIYTNEEVADKRIAR